MTGDKVFVVQAYRWGDEDNHSYVAGITSKKYRALKLADEVESDRGGKYFCSVTEWRIDGNALKVIRKISDSGIPVNDFIAAQREHAK